MQTVRQPSLTTAMSFLAAGEGALAVAELQALRATDAGAFEPHEDHYWLGLAHVLAFDWSAASTELRAFLAHDTLSWRAGWAYLHLGRVFEQAGREEEASLAYRGCLSVAGVEPSARKLAFGLMSQIANELPMSYGQAATRPIEKRRWASRRT